MNVGKSTSAKIIAKAMGIVGESQPLLAMGIVGESHPLLMTVGDGITSGTSL